MGCLQTKRKRQTAGQGPPPPEKRKKFWTFFTQKQAVLPKENINNLGPSKASPHPESIKIKKRKIRRIISSHKHDPSEFITGKSLTPPRDVQLPKSTKDRLSKTERETHPVHINLRFTNMHPVNWQ